MATMSRLVEVETGRKGVAGGSPSVGPTYRSAFAAGGFSAPIVGFVSCWDIFCMSVEKYPDNRMLGRREVVNGEPGKYVWLTYKQVYQIVMKLGASIRSCGVEKEREHI